MKFLILFLLAFNIFASSIEFETASNNTIDITTFAGNGKNLIIYLPSSRGLGNQYPKWANNLTFDGFDIWALNLHSSYMLSKTKSSIDKFNIDDIVEIANFAKAQKFKNLYFITSGRGAKLALKAAYRYQKKYKNKFIKGSIFHSPHLIVGNPKIGENADYDKIAKYNNLPVFIIISDSSTKFFRINEITKLLNSSGTFSKVRVFKNISAGFFMKPDSRLTAKDIVTRNKLPIFYQDAINWINKEKITAVIEFKQGDDKNQKNTFSVDLKPLNQVAEKLELLDLDGKKFNLESMQNKVVLLNFWASWCKPCVREIPSLLRLKAKIINSNFEIITVNIGESKAKILKFKAKLKRKKQVDFNLPILFDVDGSATRKWRIYAYPSNYIIDKKGIIKYGYRGALEWDRDDIIKTIEELL